MRVTAGGRVVPSDIPPLGSARFNNDYKQPTLASRGVVPRGTMSAQPNSDGNALSLSQRVEIVGGQAVINVGGRLYALPTINPSPNLPPVVPSVLDPAQLLAEPSTLAVQNQYSGVPLAPVRNGMQPSFSGLSVPELKALQTSKKQELRNVEQTEVLQASHQSEEWRAGMIQRKKSLILELDTLRKEIAAAEASGSKGIAVPRQPVALPNPNGSAPSLQAAFVSQYQQPMIQPLIQNVGLPVSVTPSNPYAPLMMYPHYASSQIVPSDVTQFNRDGRLFVSSENSLNGGQFQNGFNPAMPGPQSPGSATRRSHAIEIKPPRDEPKKPTVKGSVLDPRSPTYEPNKKGNIDLAAARETAPPPTPSPAKRSPWRSNEGGSAQSNKYEGRALSQKPSLSSIDTTDFFPTNTHEHSSTRIAPTKGSNSKHSSPLNMKAPSTPEKSWPSGPWNSQTLSGGKSKPNGPVEPIRLTSWNEEFGKYLSLPRGSGKPAIERDRATGISQKNTSQQTSTDQSWRLLASKPVYHIPSTYQEGYQAGYDHVGLSDNPEVLRGYLEGLAMYLKETKSYNAAMASLNSRNSSLRGHLSGGTLHDSGVSLTFPRTESTLGTQENIRSRGADNSDSAVRRGFAFSPGGNISEIPQKYTADTECAQENRSRNYSGSMHQMAAETLDRKGYVYHPAENEAPKCSQDAQLQLNPALSSISYPRQISGNQVASRISAKEYGSGKLTPVIPPFVRPAGRQRLSGLDGAMDDLAELVQGTKLDDERVPSEPAEPEASCFKSSGKGKQKVGSSPHKTSAADAKDQTASSPTKPSGSPQKSGERSPAKEKLEQVTHKVTNKFMRTDPRSMSPESKRIRTKAWRQRFQRIRTGQEQQIDDYIEDRRQKKRQEEPDNGWL
ncbi:hypothetical protein CC78DRAFT_103283 [Lojkania enalia]|uniref:Uncharacterized protein n=1 Tax=Lojkania enalia TaxID=147567 RepID=A0A9P4N665_9PLEO|nr:hypothetical protein CC78DRAFT_103283 [Didymosphaeria enalia]